MEKLDERTYKFALRILKLVGALPRTMKGETIGRQVLRSGTSVGANVEEAYGGSSKKDFANKMATALKEARESHYWLRLIRDDGMIQTKRIAPLVQEALEIKLILGKTVTTSKKSKDDE
jgi:four helix bundle protein